MMPSKFPFLEKFEEEQCNVVLTAITNASSIENNGDVYEYIDSTPIHTFVVDIVEELNKLGYTVTKNE